MATWRLFGSYSGPSSAVSYSGNFISALCFRPTQNVWFEGYWWWVAASGQSTSPVKCALWEVGVIGSAAGNLVPGTTVTSGTLTAGQWNYIPIATPVALSIDGMFNACVGCNGNFPDTAHFWDSGGPGYNDIVSGPLIAYGQNDLHAYNYNLQGGTFSTASSDPASGGPFIGVDATYDNFWVDVQVGDYASPPAGYSGSYRIWPNRFNSDAHTQSDAAVSYTIASEFHLSVPCTINKVWYYEPSGATVLPGVVSLWSLGSPATSGTQLHTNTSPTWLDVHGSAATTGVNGWLQCDVSSWGVIPAGSYKVSVFSSTMAVAGSKRLAYWGTTTTLSGEGYLPSSAAAAGGITWGPLYIPATANAGLAYSYQSETTQGTPSPTFTEPGQSTFSIGFVSGTTYAEAYPNLYVGSNSPSSSDGTNLYQNYWVDIEVSFSGVAGVASATVGGITAAADGSGVTRLFPTTNGPSAATAYSGPYVAGQNFVTTGGGWLTGYWWWCCATGQATTAVNCSLWLLHGVENVPGTPTLVPSSTVTSGTLTAGAWNYIALPSPIPLAPGIPYVAAIGMTATGFPETQHFWTTGPGAGGIVNGLVAAPAVSPVWNGAQSCFSTAGSDTTVEANFPGLNGNSDNNFNSWVDVQIAGSTPPGYVGTYRLWPGMTGSSTTPGTHKDAPANFVLATEIHVTQQVAVQKIWTFSPATADELATRVDIWTIGSPTTIGTNVYSATPSWSGTAGSGWMWTAVTGLVLPPGSYKVSMFNGSGSVDSWSPYQFQYWGGVAAAVPAGITFGPLYAPNNAAAGQAYSYGNAGTTGTHVTGDATEPANGTFAIGPANASIGDVYPNLVVGVNSGPPGPTYETFWVDLEVVPQVSVTQSGKAHVSAPAAKTATVSGKAHLLSAIHTATQSGKANLVGPGVKLSSVGGHGRLRTVGLVAAVGGKGRVFIPGAVFPPLNVIFTRQPTTTSNDTAALKMTDVNGRSPTDGAYLGDGILQFTANDNGAVVALTSDESYLIANANGVGVATVTVSGVESGQPVSGTLVVTVTLVGGQFHTAWTSGTIPAY